jgi:hypothetical protein
MALVNGGGQVVEFLSVRAARSPRAEDRRYGSPRWTSACSRTGASRWTSLQRQRRRVERAESRARSAPVTTTAASLPARSRSVTSRRQRRRSRRAPPRTFTATAFDASHQPGRRRHVHLDEQRHVRRDSERDGVATALQPGDVTITATAPNAVDGTASLHIDAPPTRPARNAVQRAATTTTRHGRREAIEIEGPARARRSRDGASCSTTATAACSTTRRPLTGTIPATCAARGVVVVNYPLDGIQNGSPTAWRS